MLTGRYLKIFAALLLAGGFAWGAFMVFRLRFAAGDVYPRYSSLRADPLGTRVLYEALQDVGNTDARRNFTPPPKLPGGRDTTLLVMGLSWTELWADEAEYRSLEQFVNEGGRLVVTLYPQIGRPRRAGVTNNPAFKRSGKSPFSSPPVDLTTKWRFDLLYCDLPREKDLSLSPVSVRTLDPGALPGEVSWHSGMVFTNVGLEWRVVYARGTDPVIIERQLGAGSLVLATDSYFASNEAMQKERQPALLTWMVGPNRSVIFDEVHLGVQQQPGIAGLARRYRLHGGALALFVIGILFVWRSAASFVPRGNEEESADMVRGRDSAAGFANLLRRSIAPAQLLQTCLDEWHKSRALDRRATPSKLERIRAAVEAHNSAPGADKTATYNQISSILNEK